MDRYLANDNEREAWANLKLIEIAATSLASFRDALEQMTEDDRYIFLSTLHDGYCMYCGGHDPMHCYCRE